MAFCALSGGLGQVSPGGYREYAVAGAHLLRHGVILSPLVADETAAVPSHLLPPAYVGIVALAYRVFGVDSWGALLALQILNALATSLAVVLVFFIARDLLGAAAGWAAAIVFAFNPAAVGFTNLIWDTALFTCGVALCLWASLRLARPPARWPAWMRFGFLLGAVALLNPALTVGYPLLVLYPLTAHFPGRWRAMAAPLVLTVSGWIIAIAPWTLRNYRLFDELMYVRGGLMLELWLGVCPEAEQGSSAVYEGQYPLRNDWQQQQLVKQGEAEYIHSRGVQAWAAIRDNPVRFARLCLRRTVDFWTGTVLSHMPPGHGFWPRSPARLMLALFLLGETLLIVVWVVRCGAASSPLGWLLGAAMASSLVYCLTHTAVRFRAPLEPILTVGAVAGAVELYRIATAARRRMVTVPAKPSREGSV